MSNVWFTSDTHFWHKNVIEYCQRPFESVEEMNETLIKNWNDRVKKNDTIYILGDFCFGTKEQCIEILGRLNGQKFLIYGNHDVRFRSGAFAKYFQWRGDLKEIKIDDQRFVLCHFAMRTWHKQHKGAIHLYGHSHGNLPEDPNSLSTDVGVDALDFRPIGIDMVLDYMAWKKGKIDKLAEDRGNK